MATTSGGYMVQSTVQGSGPSLYWMVGNDGVVSMRATPTSQDWSVRSGILFYQGNQVFYDTRAGRFTTRPPVGSSSTNSNAFSSPIAIQNVEDAVATSPTNWLGNLTTVYSLSNPSAVGGKALFSQTPGERLSYSLPVYGEQVGVTIYPVLGANATNASPLLPLTSRVQRGVGNVAIEVPLSGFVPQPSLGDVVQGKPATITPQGGTVNSSSWIWYGLLILISILIIVGALWLVISKKKVTRPLIEEPLFQAALLSK